MGFSVVSIIELIYFMTFRPYCAQHRIEDDEQANQIELFTISMESKKPQAKYRVAGIRRFASRIHQKLMSILPTDDTRAFYPYTD